MNVTGPSRSSSAMPRLPARDQEVARIEPLEHHAPGLLERALVPKLDPRQRLDLGLVRSRRRRAPEARQVVAAVHGHDGAAPAGRLETASKTRGVTVP